VLDVDVLTREQMEAIDRRQVRQQSEWKAIPSEGQVVSFLGTELVVLPGVFPPKEDTVLLAEHIPISDSATILDVGTGTGALAIWAAQQGATSVIAVDIAAAAVRNAERNVERLGFEDRIEVRRSHVFSRITRPESFDIILANLPGRNKAAVDDTSVAQWDTNFQAHRALFEGARNHLRSGGAIYMAKANYPDLLEMLTLAETCGYEVTVIGQSIPEEGIPRRYYALCLNCSAP
jgi:methylase of polypeptide subunit release factors